MNQGATLTIMSKKNPAFKVQGFFNYYLFIINFLFTLSSLPSSLIK